MPARVNYIYIDYENVREKDLSRIEGRSAVVHLVLGARQPDPAPELHHQIQRLVEKAELIQTPIAAKNSLDFVLACEVGMQAARDPDGYFHVVSNDKGFDVLVKHLRKKKILASRCAALREVPALMTTEERLTGSWAISTIPPPPSLGLARRWHQRSSVLLAAHCQTRWSREPSTSSS